jgi:hypothetical protein
MITHPSALSESYVIFRSIRDRRRKFERRKKKLLLILLASLMLVDGPNSTRFNRRKGNKIRDRRPVVQKIYSLAREDANTFKLMYRLDPYVLK